MGLSVPVLPQATPEFLYISGKPNAPISYTFFPATSASLAALRPRTLIIFVNGLGLPASSWTPAITKAHGTLRTCPAILIYDRFGQGLTTTRDPLDGREGKERGHDLLDVANDLHEIILTTAASKLGLQKTDAESGKLHLVLVGASIGGPIARLYTQNHPGLVSGMIILDSNIANVNYSDFLLDPDSPEFDPDKILSGDCTLQQYREARTKLAQMFDLGVRNPESLDRTTSPDLLPYSDAPKLIGPGNIGPLLTVVGHDPETFADMSYEMMGTPKSMSMITNRYWSQYNEGLTKITDEGRCKEVLIAKGCGHFIQKDDPDFVAEVLSNMIEELGW